MAWAVPPRLVVPARFRAAVVDEPRVGTDPKPVDDAGEDIKDVEENKLPTPPILVPTPLDRPAGHLTQHVIHNKIEGL